MRHSKKNTPTRIKQQAQDLQSTKELESTLHFHIVPNNSKSHNKKVFMAHLLESHLYLLDDKNSCLEYFDENFDYNLGKIDVNTMRVIEYVLPIIKKHFHTFKFPSYMKANFKILEECFNLKPLDIQIAYICNLVDSMQRELNNISGFNDCIYIISSFLGVKPRVVATALTPNGKLRKLGFVEGEDKSYRDGDFIFEATDFFTMLLLEPYSKDKILKRVAMQIPESKLNLEDFDYMREDIEMILELCHKHKNPSFYLYGAPGVGKNEIVKLISKLTQKSVYEIYEVDENGETSRKKDRFERFYMTQNILDSKKHIILVDECEDIFTHFNSRNNRLIESVRVPTFFLSNSIDLDPALLRRFDLVLEITAPPREKKAQIITNALKEHKITLDSALIDKIVESNLTQGTLIKACEVANALIKPIPKGVIISRPNKSKNRIQEAFLRVLNEQLKALCRQEISPKTLTPPPYDMHLINASIDMASLAKNIKDSAYGARILSYGIAGSGKSEYAKALAKKLDKPIIIKRASDLLDMHLGVTEKRIAQAFREANRQKAVLVFDEVDSFLQERSGAQRSWEVTQVNEMLTQMEIFEGIFIATTNLMDSLDKASIRRFDIKVEFRALDVERLLKAFRMYAKYLGIKDTREFLQSHSDELKRLDNICFGDFALIARNARLKPLKSAIELYEGLLVEFRIKDSYRNDKRVGF